MTRQSFLLFTLIFGVLAAGFYMAPSPKEVALMHMRDANYNEALKFYTDLHKQGDDTINVVAPLIKLHIHYGDAGKAIAVLENFVAAHPQAVDARKQLAELYKGAQRFNDYCRVLEDLNRLSPSASNLRKLADMYEFLGRYPDEIHVLAALIDTASYMPREDDYAQLALLDRVNGQPDEAIRVILAGLDAKRYKVNPDTARLAAQLLLEKGKDGKALSVAGDYLKKSGSENEAVALSSLFQTYDKLDGAEELLTPYIADIDHSPLLEQQIVGLWLVRKKEDQVFALLSRQAQQHVMPDFLTTALADLAIKRKDYDLAETTIENADLKSMPESALLRYVEFSLQNHRPALGQAMQEKLGKDYLQTVPLLAALLDVAVHDTPESMATLLALPPGAFPEPDEKLIVANILIQHGYESQAYALFKDIPIIDAFDTLDSYQVASLYLAVNESGKGENQLTAARAQASPEIQATIDKSLFFLYVGEGNISAVEQRLDSHDINNNAEILSDAHELAKRYHHDVLAQELAQRIYDIKPTKENLLQLADALLDNRHYAEAIKYLQKPAAKNGEARQLYLDGISDWIQHSGTGAVPESTLALFRAAIVSELARPNLKRDEKRNFAYLLQNTGFRDLAGNVFFDLAAGQPYNSEDVSNLLGFWGDQLSPEALDWVVGRARDASGPERVAWLTYLNDTRHPQEVIALLRDDRHLSPQLDELYVNALIDAHEKKHFGPVLAEAIDRESNAPRLKRLLDAVGGQKDIQPIIDRGWRKLYRLDPDDKDAEREVGLIELAAKRYDTAEQLLAQNLQENDGDYETNEAYAEILQHNGKKSEAEPYLKRALKQVSDSKDKNLDTQLDKAHLLYQNHQLDKSLALFRELLAQHPQDKTLRADFAEILIENHLFDEASSVLAQ